jgi:hypothetical protein
LSAEVKEDGVRFPAANSANRRLVDARDKEGGGTPGAEAVGFDTVRGDVGDVENGGGRTAQFGRDVARSDVVGVIGGVEVAVEGACRTRVMFSKVENTTASGQYGAKDEIPREAMAECLPTSGVLLVGVGKGHIGSLLHVIQRTVISGGTLDERAAEGGIHETKRVTTAPISSRRESVFPRATEEVKGEHTKIKDCLGPGLVGRKGEASHQGSENGDVDGPDSGWSGVGISPSFEESL